MNWGTISMIRCAERAGLLLVLALAACAGGSPPRPAPVHAAPAEAVPATPAPSADKGDPDARFKAALALMKDKKHAEAQAAFAQLAVDFPEYSGPLTDLGILFAQAKHREAAFAALSKAVAANPKNAIAQNWLGIVYRESGDYAHAEQAYRGALAARPDYAPAHLNLGILYDVCLKRPQDALEQYRAYQQYAGDDKLMVAVWIKELEAGDTMTASSGSAP
jgi:tetratricopeptide (TPR) repeat protein